MRKFRFAAILALLAVLVLSLPASAGSNSFPDLIPLPVGFRPEGIAVGKGSTFYTGSLMDGAILRGDLRTGQTAVLVAGQEGMVSVGMDYDERTGLLYVAGGATGMARVFNTRTGELVQSYQLADPGIFINDVIVTRTAAYFTNSNQAVLYRLPLAKRGVPPQPEDVHTLELSGDWQQLDGFNANGIEATRDGRWLVVVNSTLGNLYRVNPRTGAAKWIDLGAEGAVTNGDGLLLQGSMLFVVRNRLNEIAVVNLSRSLTSGKVLGALTNPDFNVPTTIAVFGKALYAVNAKFGDPAPNDIPYEIVRVEIKR